MDSKSGKTVQVPRKTENVTMGKIKLEYLYMEVRRSTSCEIQGLSFQKKIDALTFTLPYKQTGSLHTY